MMTACRSFTWVCGSTFTSHRETTIWPATHRRRSRPSRFRTYRVSFTQNTLLKHMMNHEKKSKTVFKSSTSFNVTQCLKYTEFMSYLVIQFCNLRLVMTFLNQLHENVYWSNLNPKSIPWLTASEKPLHITIGKKNYHNIHFTQTLRHSLNIMENWWQIWQNCMNLYNLPNESWNV